MQEQYPLWPKYEADEIAEAMQILASGRVNYWTGNKGRKFEQQFAEYIGCKHAIAVANGTLALELALRAINLAPGDEVIVPSKTFIATASVVVTCNASPVVADVELDSHNISAATIEPLITSRTKAVVVVHLNGIPCDMEPIIELARANNLVVIEDCAQAHGAIYKNKKIGSYGDISTFSFCQDKIMSTAGEGGMLLTNNESFWKKAWSYKDHGKDYDLLQTKNPKPGFRYVHTSFGTNYRLTELQSAVGLLQLSKLDKWIEARTKNAEILRVAIKDNPAFRAYEPNADSKPAYYKFQFNVVPENLNKGLTRNMIIAELQKRSVPCAEGCCSEIYLEQAFTNNNLGPTQRLPNASVLSETSLILPVHPNLTPSHMHKMVEAINEVMSHEYISN